MSNDLTYRFSLDQTKVMVLGTDETVLVKYVMLSYWLVIRNTYQKKG